MKYGLFIAGLIAASTISTSHASNAEQVKSNFVISSYAKTKYPLVFAHGMGGWIRVGTDELGVDYWYQILPDLARNGANAWATRVSPFNSSEVRGEQLLQQVDEILAITGANKVNLLGHSHGGHSIAYVSNIAPAKVASATAISSPLKGSPVADFILKVQGTPLEKPLMDMVNLVSKTIIWAQGLDPNSYPHDSLAAGISLSQAGSKTFAQKYTLGMPESACGEGAAIDNGIYFYSFSGNSTLTNILDPDSVLAATGLLMQAPNDNDGLVSRCSAKYGKTIRDNYNWNHLDVINQFFALRSVFSPDPVDIYRQHANRLNLQGL